MKIGNALLLAHGVLALIFFTLYVYNYMFYIYNITYILIALYNMVILTLLIAIKKN